MFIRNIFFQNNTDFDLPLILQLDRPLLTTQLFFIQLQLISIWLEISWKFGWFNQQLEIKNHELARTQSPTHAAV